MAEPTKTVETKVETAVAQPQVVAPVTATQDDDLAKQLEDTRAALAKKTQDAENYKRGMLKAKGKIPDDKSDADDDGVETTEEMMRRIAREEQDRSEIARLQAQERSQLDAVLKRNKELEVALKNRGQITSVSGMGSNEDKPEVKTDSYFSPEQIAHFKAQGKSDEWIETAKKNMLKGNQQPR